MRTIPLLLLAVALAGPLGTAAPAQDIAAMEQQMIRVAEQARQSVVRVSADRSWPPMGGEVFTTSYSGVVWDAEGRIVTAADAVVGAKTVRIETVDGKVLDANVLGMDELTNTAIVKADPKALKPISVGKSADVKVGSWVFAIGNPFGLSGSVSLGIVSGVNRRIDRDGRALWNMIQITAPINPGDTGGAVVNSRGELIGIIHSTYGRAPSVEGLWHGPGIHHRGLTRSAVGAEGINFVMPVDAIAPIAAQLAKYGEVRRGWLGVGMKTISADLPADERQNQTAGVIVVRVLPQSPAIQAGIQIGDVLTSYNGKPLSDSGQLGQWVGETEPAQQVEIKGIRKGEAKSFQVRIGRAPQSDNDYQRILGDLVPLLNKDWLGVFVDDGAPKPVQGEETPAGAVVVSVVPGSPAERMGLLGGDVIVKLNEKEIHSALELKDALVSGQPTKVAGGEYRVEVLRNGKRVSMSSP